MLSRFLTFLQVIASILLAGALVATTLGMPGGTALAQEFPAPDDVIDGETPTAHGGPTQRLAAGTLVFLDGSTSTDPDGDYPLTYKWHQVGGTPVQLSNETFSVTTFVAPALPTVMGFYLTVTDSEGHESPPDAVVVAVIESPLSGFSSDSSSPTVIGHSTTFTASVSTTATVSYAWDYGDGTLGSGPQSTHVYTQPGQYEVTVLAGADDITAIQSFIVIVVNPVPIGSAVITPTVAYAGSRVNLDASASYDPNGDSPLDYTWVQVVGPRVSLQNSNSAQPSFIAPSSSTTATLIFNMSVRDSYAGTSDPVTVTLTLMPSLVLGAGENNFFLPLLY